MKKFVLAIVIVSVIVLVGVSITVALSDNINLFGIKVDELQVYGETIKYEKRVGGHISEDGVVHDCPGHPEVFSIEAN